MSPRIRSLKPDIWLSPDFRTLSTLGKLVFIALISQADDSGRLRMNAQHLATVFLQVFQEDVQHQLDLMVKQGMIVCYSLGRADYVQVVHFPGHQRIDKPQMSKLPPPPARIRRSKAQLELGLLQERSKNPHGTVSESSKNVLAGLDKKGMEGNGSRKGMEGMQGGPDQKILTTDDSKPASEVWAEMKEKVVRN